MRSHQRRRRRLLLLCVSRIVSYHSSHCWLRDFAGRASRTLWCEQLCRAYALSYLWSHWSPCFLHVCESTPQVSRVRTAKRSVSTSAWLSADSEVRFFIERRAIHSYGGNVAGNFNMATYRTSLLTTIFVVSSQALSPARLS